VGLGRRPGPKPVKGRVEVAPQAQGIERLVELLELGLLGGREHAGGT
jgi:hypothetical protein